MSYDPSHYQPPAQGRWPNATPPEPWPSYQDGDVYRDEERADGQYGADRRGAYPPTAGYQRRIGYQRAAGEPGDHSYPSAVATDAFPPARSGYATADGYGPADGYADAGTGNGYGVASGYVTETRSEYAPGGYAEANDSFDGAGYGRGSSQTGYAGTVSGYAPVADGYAPVADGYVETAGGYDWSGSGYGTVTDGFDGAQDNFTRPVGYTDQAGYTDQRGYTDRGGYGEAAPGGAGLAAPDAGLDPASWRAERDRRRAAGQRGLAVGAVTGVLAVAVATGISTLVAAFVRPQAAPAIAIGDVFIDRVPAGLRNAAMAHGSHGRMALLLVMYLAIGFVALGMGVLSRRAAALGVASLAAFTMVSAFVTISRPGGRAADTIPAIVGGVAGVAALLWLQRASAPVAPYPPAPRGVDRGGSRRRAR